MEKGKVWVMKNEGLCVISTLINTVDFLGGQKSARRLHIEQGKMKAKIRSLSDLKHLIQGGKYRWTSDSVSKIIDIQLKPVKIRQANWNGV